MRGIILALGMLTLATPASAQGAEDPFLRGNWFVRNCDSPSWKLSCGAYLLGYFHGSQSRLETICLPNGVDTGQLIEVALAYMRSHPEKGHYVAMMLADEAWASAFPCR